jgi:hypothetical protein
MFTVTKQWVMTHSSGNLRGGWTKAQLEAISLSWPPPKGWLEALIGSMLEDDQRNEFERLGRQHRETQARDKAEAEVRYARMSEEVYYTWPVDDGWNGSFKKPAGWWR